MRCTDQIQFHTPNHSQVRTSHAGQFRNLLVDPRATHACHISSVRRTDQIQFHIHSHSPVRASHAGFPKTYSSTHVRRSRLHHYGRTISRRRVQRTLTTLLACVALTKFSFTRPTTHRSERRTRVSPQPTRRPACDALVCTSRTHHLAETSATHAHHSSSVRCTNQIQFHTSNHSQVRASHVGFPTTYSSPNQPSGGSNNLALIPARSDTVASSKQRSSRSFALKYVFRILNC